jgi:hypothetical protein
VSAMDGRTITSQRPGVARAHRYAAIRERITASFSARSAHPEEIDGIYRLGISLIDRKYHLTPEHLVDLMSVCPEAVTVIEKADPVSPVIAGYFVILPLNARGCGRVLGYAARSVFDLTARDLCARLRQASAIYIAQAGGRDVAIERTAVLVSLYDVITDVLTRGERDPYVFARPGSQDGRRWLTTMSFAPLNPARSHIWSLPPERALPVFGQSDLRQLGAMAA